MGFSLVLVVIGWLYVALLMAAAEAASPNGTWLGAWFTFILYGAIPLAIIIYIGTTPLRKARRVKNTSLKNESEGEKDHPPEIRRTD